MIMALVQIPLDAPKRPHDAVTRQSLDSTKFFHEVKGLRRKYCLNSEAAGDGGYEFVIRQEVEAWFNDGRADWMEGRFGVRPVLTLFDNPVVLDNEAGGVRVDGVPVDPPWETQGQPQAARRGERGQVAAQGTSPADRADLKRRAVFGADRPCRHAPVGTCAAAAPDPALSQKGQNPCDIVALAAAAFSYQSFASAP